MKSSLFPLPILLLLATGPAGAAGPLVHDTGRYSQAVTECDRLAAHPDDPHRVAAGVPQSAVDLPAAIAACERAVSSDPRNPRLRYQLARVYGYSGQGERGVEHREAAIAGDYPQALFVVGFLHLEGLNQATRDPCRAGQLIRRSAQYGRLAGQVGFPMWTLEGRFAGCDVPQEPAELLAFLDAAAARTSDFYQGSLIRLLRRDVEAAKSRGE